MSGPFPYLQSINPPAPGCSVTLSYDDRSGDYEAIIDSAADITAVPAHIVKALGLRKIAEIEIGGSTDRDFRKQSVHRVNLEFLGLVFAYHKIVSLEGAGIGDHILIGRDILNRYRVVLDGPTREFTKFTID